MKGVEAVTPDSALLTRARQALAAGALDAATLMARVCALPSAPDRVAQRLAEALFDRHADFERAADGRWQLVNVLRGDDARSLRAEELAAPGPVSPETVRARRAAPSARASDAIALRDVRFAVVDVETTGMTPAQHDRVTEIAVVQVDGLEVGDCYETLVNPGRAIPSAIVALTQITQAMVDTAPRFCDVASDVVGRLRERVFVAHNASFDWRFVSHEVQRAAGVVLTGETLCTVRLSRRLLPQLPRRSLDAVTRYFGIDIAARHRAAGDALATAHVLVRLLRLAEDRGVESWGALADYMASGTARRSRRRSAMPRGVDIDPTL